MSWVLQKTHVPSDLACGAYGLVILLQLQNPTARLPVERLGKEWDYRDQRPPQQTEGLKD